MNVAQLLVSCLENEGVRYVFGLPGEENLEFLHAIKKSGRMELVVTRDERGASFMAAAWGRLTGRPGVCVSTLGPGAINMLLGVADAFLDFSPLVAITAQKNLSETFKEAHQYVDVFSIYKPVTKWGASIGGKNVPEIVRKAFRVAQTEKPGPTHLELPEDVASADAGSQEPMQPVPIRYPEPPEDAVKTALGMIEEAKNPVVIAGGGVIRAGASRELLKFMRKFMIPLATTFMAMGAVPSDEELFISTVGLQQKDYISCGLEKADLIITVGYDPVEFSPRYWRKEGAGRKAVIHISATPAETDAAYQSFELVGDIRRTLSKLVRAKMAKTGKAPKEPSFFVRLKELERKGMPLSLSGWPVKPLRLVSEMRGVLGKKDVLVSDVGAHKAWIARFYEAMSPGTVLISNGLASMGFAIPSAIAAKILCPERKVIAAVGDGGFLMSMSELETASRLSLSFTVVIWNDGGYGLIGWKERARFGEEFFTEFGNPDFVKLAESFNARGYRVEKESELGPILRDALKTRGISVIDCPVDYGENLKLSGMMGDIICPT